MRCACREEELLASATSLLRDLPVVEDPWPPLDDLRRFLLERCEVRVAPWLPDDAPFFLFGGDILRRCHW